MGRFWLGVGFSGQCCVGVFLAVFILTSLFPPPPPLFVYLFACLFFLCSLLDEVPGLFIWRPKPWCVESQKNPSLPFCYPHLLLLTGYLLLLLFWQAELYSSHSSSSSSSSSTAHFSASLFHSYSFPLSFGNSATFFFFYLCDQKRGTRG